LKNCGKDFHKNPMSIERNHQSLEEIRAQYGEEAYLLARTLIHGFGKIGKGKNGPELLNFMADAVEKRTVRFNQLAKTFVYKDATGKERSVGEENDPLSLVLLEWASALHASVPEAQHVSEENFLEGIQRLGRGVSRVLDNRRNSAALHRIMDRATFGLFSKK
jgi:hypothetical protein